MTVELARIIWNAIGVYLLVGILFAVAFVWHGAGRLDPAARRGSVGFRLLIVPGSALLWPILAWKWMRGTTR